MANLADRIVAKAAGVLAGVPASDIERIMVGDPTELRDQARKVLGLEVQDIALIKNIKRLTPTIWSLQYLDIPQKIYQEYLATLRRQAKEVKDEYPEIKLINEVNEVKDNMPKIDGYLNFYTYLINVCRPLFNHTTKWRYIPPKLHIEVAKSILEDVLTRNSITLLDVFRVSMFMYYGVFNAISGVKIDRELQMN